MAWFSFIVAKLQITITSVVLRISLRTKKHWIGNVEESTVIERMKAWILMGNWFVTLFRRLLIMPWSFCYGLFFAKLQKAIGSSMLGIVKWSTMRCIGNVEANSLSAVEYWIPMMTQYVEYCFLHGRLYTIYYKFRNTKLHQISKLTSQFFNFCPCYSFIKFFYLPNFHPQIYYVYTITIKIIARCKLQSELK